MIKRLIERWRNYKDSRKMKYIERVVNESIVIRNDMNDKDNRCYIYVNGIPIWSVEGVSASAEIVKVIKRYYERQLNNQPCYYGKGTD